MIMLSVVSLKVLHYEFKVKEQLKRAIPLWKRDQDVASSPLPE